MLHSCVANGVVVLPGQGERRMDIGIVDGVVVGHYAPGTAPAAATVIDATDRVVVPGLVDPHLHIGLGNGLADWATETRSAAAGGVTSVFTYLMSGDSYLPVIAENRAAAAASAIVDYGFHTVPCSPTHLAEMDRYVIEHGVTSHKYFTSFRGDEGAYLGVNGTDDGFLFDYLITLGHYDGTIANIHPENIEVVWRLRAQLQAAGRDDLRAWDESRPDYVEAECVFRTLFYARQANCPVYIVHISSRRALDEFRAWRARFPSAPVWGETCPHYLTHHRDLPIGAGGKVNPPLRSPDDNEALWAGLLDGTIDTIGSDHVPRRKAKKTGSIWTASAGFPNTACILPVLLSEGVHRRGLSLTRLVDLCCANPAKAMGCWPRKGSLAIGADADLTLIDLAATRVVDPAMFHSYADYSLYDGQSLTGWPTLTMARGQVVMRDGAIVGTPGHGRYLARVATRRS